MSVKNLTTPICSLQIACDGATLYGPRRAAGSCGKCAEAQEKRHKVVPPKGINSALPSHLLKKDLKGC